ncbi:hypothetical protein [Paenibacillus faecalis]|uniref:hypothetical protein n=1 Tax=Paenibacillus faecalis TaxID=2079532 RepID=UPI000D0EEC89|nr:hypothetical protein [Paenibacillus faecalis]
MSFTKEIAKQILSYFPYRYINVGKEFYVWLNKFERMKTMTSEQIREAQFQSFVNMVTYAYQETTFYQQLYDAHGFHPGQLKDFSDIRRIPLINKQMVKACGRDIIADRHKHKRLLIGATSGSTGKSLTLYSNRAINQREWAATCFMWQDVGYRPGDGRVELRGLFAGEEEYKMDPYHRVLRVNVSRLSHYNIEMIMKRILETGYEFIHGYPSSVSLFSRLVLENNLVNHYRPKAIMLASETVYDYQIDTIRKAFPVAKLNMHYGQSEKVVTACWDVDGIGYSFNPLYGYTEIDPDTNALIGTSFINDVTPFIRYELMDVATVTDTSIHPADSYLLPTIRSIDGRVSEIMYRPSGDMVSSALVAIALRGTASVTACKLIQHQLNEIEMVVETTRSEKELMDEIKPILKRLQVIFTNEMSFKITLVTHIPKEPSGKLKTVEVLIDREGVPV